MSKLADQKKTTNEISTDSENAFESEKEYDADFVGQETDEKSGGIHSGHRARLRERYAKEGLQNFAPHEVLEILLYQYIPYRDCNELAHKMLDRFGSLKNPFCRAAPVFYRV